MTDQKTEARDNDAPIIMQPDLRGLPDGTILLELGLVTNAADLAARKISATWCGKLQPEQAAELGRNLIAAAELMRHHLSGAPAH